MELILSRVLSIDPGKGTGWAGVDLTTRKWRMGCFVASLGEYHARFECWLEEMSPNILIYEDFVYMVKHIDGGGYTQQIDLTAKEYIGICKAYAQRNPGTCEIVKRQPGQGFKLWDDNKLKRLGLYVKGSKNTNGAPHTRDATRHALDHIVTKLHRHDFIEALKPKG